MTERGRTDKDMNLRRETKILAVSSMLAALSIVIQWAGALIQIGSYTAALFSGLLLVPVLDLGGMRYGVVFYGAVSALSWILMPDKEIPVVYMLLCLSPLLHPLLRKKLPRLTARLVEILVFIGICLAAYPLISMVFMMSDLEAEFQMSGNLVELGFIGVSTIIFILFQLCCAKTEKWWAHFKKSNKFLGGISL